MPTNELPDRIEKRWQATALPTKERTKLTLRQKYEPQKYGERKIGERKMNTIYKIHLLFHHFPFYPLSFFMFLPALKLE